MIGALTEEGAPWGQTPIMGTVLRRSERVDAKQFGHLQTTADPLGLTNALPDSLTAGLEQHGSNLTHTAAVRSGIQAAERGASVATLPTDAHAADLGNSSTDQQFNRELPPASGAFDSSNRDEAASPNPSAAATAQEDTPAGTAGGFTRNGSNVNISAELTEGSGQQLECGPTQTNLTNIDQNETSGGGGAGPPSATDAQRTETSMRAEAAAAIAAAVAHADSMPGPGATLGPQGGTPGSVDGSVLGAMHGFMLCHLLLVIVPLLMRT